MGLVGSMAGAGQPRPKPHARACCRAAAQTVRKALLLAPVGDAVASGVARNGP